MSLEVAFSTYPREYLLESIVALNLETYKIDRIWNTISTQFDVMIYFMIHIKYTTIKFNSE